jgi:hypothetical protein
VQESIPDEQLAEAYLRHLATRDESLFWAFQHIQWCVREDPARAWRLTLSLISAAQDERAISFVGAGPLENLLYNQGEQFIDEVERIAAADPKFHYALRFLYGPFTKENDTANRIAKLRGR